MSLSTSDGILIGIPAGVLIGGVVASGPPPDYFPGVSVAARSACSHAYFSVW